METLELVKILEKPKISHDEAIRLAEAIVGKNGYVTSREFKEETTEIKREFKEETTEIKREFKEETTEIKEKITNLEMSINEKMAKLETSTNIKMAKLETSNKWIITLLVGGFSLISGGIVSVLIKLYIP